MKQRLSLLIAALFVMAFVAGCSGMSEEEAKKVDLNAKPTNAPVQKGAAGQPDKPGPGAKSKAA